MVFQRSDGLADGRLSDLINLRSFGEAFALGQVAEDLQTFDLHVYITPLFPFGPLRPDRPPLPLPLRGPFRPRARLHAPTGENCRTGLGLAPRECTRRSRPVPGAL